MFAVAVERIDGTWEHPEHTREWCYRFQYCDKTSTVSARLHLKSITALSYIAWQLFRQTKRYHEIEMMCYKQDLAEYQLKKLKRYIGELPEIFGDCVPMTKAETYLYYLNGRGCEFLCLPSGILSFKRGRHPHEMICDDILKDPEAKLDTEQLAKLTRTFNEEIMQMPTEKIHVTGTPQDKEDIFGQLEKNDEFDNRVYPAMSEEAFKHIEDKSFDTDEVLWGSYWSFKRMQNRYFVIGEKAFKKEFMCRPVRGVEAFIDEVQYDALTLPRLKNYHQFATPKLREFTYGGFDIGKKSHPSHCAIFGVNRKGQLVQILSKWMDGWDYTDQLEYLQTVIENFKVDFMFYDNTRGEFEGFDERGELPENMFPFNFTKKNKQAMATELDKMVTQGNIFFVNDKRQKNQILCVDNDLKAPESSEGHGDSFFSVCLGVCAYLKGQGEIAWLL